MALSVSRSALDDDEECIRELCRIVGVSLPSAGPMVENELAELIAKAGPDRSRWVFEMVRAQLQLLVAGPPPATFGEGPAKGPKR
jgi:hypothetical protein